MNKKIAADDTADTLDITKAKQPVLTPKKLNFNLSPLPLGNTSLNSNSPLIDKKNSPRNNKIHGHKEPRSARGESPRKKNEHLLLPHVHRRDDAQNNLQHQLIQELQRHQRQQQQQMLVADATSPSPSPRSAPFNLTTATLSPEITKTTTLPSAPHSVTIHQNSQNSSSSNPASLSSTPSESSQKTLPSQTPQASRRRSSSSPQYYDRIAINSKSVKNRSLIVQETLNSLPKSVEINSTISINNHNINPNQNNINYSKKSDEPDPHEQLPTPPSCRLKHFSFLASKNHNLDERELYHFFKCKEPELADHRDAISPFRYLKLQKGQSSSSSSATPRNNLSRSSTPPIIDLVQNAFSSTKLN
jgi:hypothetical protein